MMKPQNLDITLIEADLPLWMKQARRSVDWGVLVVMFFSLLLAWAFFLQEGLPDNNATQNYAYMAYNYRESLREGVIYPRWSAPAVYGYGAPIPNYYPPGAPYTAAALDLLFFDDTLLAVRMVYALSLITAGVMTYVFVMRWAGAGAGVIAALLYVYSPYVGLTVPHVIGDLPDMMALALLPAVLWAANRVLLLNHSMDAIWLAGLFAALILTDIPFAILTGGLAIILMCITPANRGRYILLSMAMLCGVGLASIYWLPAWLEHGLVRWQPPAYEPLPASITLSGLFAPLRRIDLNAQINHPQITLGYLGISFSLLAALAVYQLRRWKQGVFLFIGVVLLLICLWTQQIWVMGGAVFCLSVGGSAALSLCEQLLKTQHRVILPLLLLGILALSFPAWLSPRWEADLDTLDPATQINYEIEGLGVAALPPGADLPLTLNEPITPSTTLITGYQTGQVIRIPPARLTGDRQANLLFSRTHSDRYQVSTRSLTRFDVLRAYAPGWYATLNNRQVSLDPDPQTGLMVVTIPEATTNANLEINYGSTPQRDLARFISLTSLLLILLFTVIRLLRDETRVFYDDVQLLLVEDARLLGLICAGFGLVILLFVVPGAPYTLYPRSGAGLDGYIGVRARTDVGMEMLAFQVHSGADYHVGDDVMVTLAWRASRRLLQNYRVQVYLVDADAPQTSPRWRITSARYPGGYPTHRWITGEYVLDPHRISTATIPPGDYRIAVILTYCNPTCPPESKVNFFSSSGEFIGERLVLPVRLNVQ